MRGRVPWLPRMPWLSLLALGVLGCDRGDWFPPERTVREVLNGWDMWDTAVVPPYRAPLVIPPAGAVPTNAGDGFATAQAGFAKLPPAQQKALAARSFRRFCHHCHGPNGDGRIIVGESFSPRLPDLRSPATQARGDRDIYDQVMAGGPKMIPLADTLTPLEAVAATAHLRSLADAPSKPFFPRPERP